MKMRTILAIMSCFSWLVPAVATPEFSQNSLDDPSSQSVEILIQKLSDERFKVREEASQKLWEIGEPALAALKKAAVGVDPEQAHRARELIRKIELRLTPETASSIMKLAERYAKAERNEKVSLFDQLQKQRAWWQMLKLFAAETDPEVQARLQRMVSDVAITGARESLLQGNASAAQEYLEMAPADAAGLLALADFHRSQGTLDAELARAKTLKGPRSNAWLLALYRASGDLDAARTAANAAGEEAIAAGLSILLGNPLPWLRRGQAEEENGKVLNAYTGVAIRRWQGELIPSPDLEILKRMGKARLSDEDREEAIGALFLLGQVETAEAELGQSSSRMAFTYFESQERIAEALQAVGIDPEKPDYKAWIEKRLKAVGESTHNEEEPAVETADLLDLANFMERRGLDKELDEAFREPLLDLAAKDDQKFLDFLGSFFEGNQGLSVAPRLAMGLAIDWAGNDEQRWEDLIHRTFGPQEGVIALWDWIVQLDPQATRTDRFKALLALKGIGADPHQLREKWLGKLWDLLAKTPEENRKPLLDKAKLIISLTPDLEANMKLWTLLPKEEAESFKKTRILYFTASGKWDEAANFFLEQIQAFETSKKETRLEFHACAAACLRKAGRIQEAAHQDDLVDKLSLSKNAFSIAAGYAWGDDFEQAARWYAKAAAMADPLDNEFVASLEPLGENLLKKGTWKEAGAIYEVIAQAMVTAGSGQSNPSMKLRVRMQADLARALFCLKTDREQAISRLESCHRMFPGDGSLADYFFPAVRTAGLIQEHDRWFRTSWNQVVAVIKKFPNSDNTCNTAAWLASRAARNLDEAQEFLERALTMNPHQSAYLDTMAEIQFAKGRREEALKWSTRAVNFTPGDPMLRKQREHFRLDPFPK